jgi:cytochrome c oxidase subunit 2
MGEDRILTRKHIAVQGITAPAEDKSRVNCVAAPSKRSAARHKRTVNIPPIALRATCLAIFLLNTACEGVQSALAPAGRDAKEFSELFLLMASGAVVLWLVVFGLFVYTAAISTRPLPMRFGTGLIVWGGIVLPTVTLTALLIHGLSMIPGQEEAGSGLTVHIRGEQWWWRVTYFPEDGAPVVSANELRFPANQRTEIRLTAANVIHSFWIPSLSGKIDMFPGRETRMAVEPLEPGLYRGQCAEFCGLSHALMAFDTVVMRPEEFAEWIQAERASAIEPVHPEALRGREVFLAQGCGACHAIRGTPAAGRFGPDLTHVASRRSIAAATLPNEIAALSRWISHAGEVKPGARMPSYEDLPRSDRSALVRYLGSLR